MQDERKRSDRAAKDEGFDETLADEESSQSSSATGVAPRPDERGPSLSSLGPDTPSGSASVPADLTPTSARSDTLPLSPEEARELSDAPTRLGHYRILGELGRGGMGVVYAARDPRLERKVAIKQLHSEGHPEHRRRLVREGLAMARLSHPNVISIFEIGERGDSTFIVMEYVDGVTLRGWLERPRERSEILAVFESAARGLIAAHRQGLIHRDFKPANVMVGHDGRVRVMDFGLARLREDPDVASTSAGSTAVAGPSEGPSSGSFDALTRTGALLGTPAYMPPELIRGEQPDTGADQFSFCVALHEALYGQRPFAERSLAELQQAILAGELEPPPPEAEVPSWLRELIVRGLDPDRSRRHPSMQALLDALVRARLAHAVDDREPPAYAYVAHASLDKLAVSRLCQSLLDHGVYPWLDLWELDPEADEAVELDALREAPALILCRGPGGEPHRGATALALTARIERDPATVYRVALPGVGARADELALDLDSWDHSVVELAARIGVARERETWLAREAERADLAPDELAPFRGLEPFREVDARWMFGREHELAELLDLLRNGERRFLTLIGASGSGKSSLIAGGLCPMLRRGGLGDGRFWSIVHLRPGPRPCEALARACAALLSKLGEPTDVDALRRELLTHDDALQLLVRRVRRSGQARELLLVVDQLEELFTAAELGADEDPSSAAAEALAFVRNVQVATEPVAEFGGCAWVVATLRADFVQRGLEVGALARVLKGGTYFALPPLGEQQLRAAIERPARRVGHTIEARLVETLVAGAAHQAGRLPLLQHVLRELWLRRDSEARVLRYESYAETGGLEGAIAVAAERGLATIRASLGERGQRLTRRIMTRLVHLGERQAGDTRRRAALTELGDEPEILAVLDGFVQQARVLVASEVEGEVVVEIAHEALLREWTTLAGWLDADRDALRLRQELARFAAEHDRHGAESLWSKGRVEEARRVLAASVVELNESERVFLDQSERLVVARERRRWIAVAVALALALTVQVVLVRKNQRISAQSDTLASQTATLESQNLALADKEREQERLLSEQRGLRAQMLIPTNDEAEALLLAVQALGVHGPTWTGAPPQPAAAKALAEVLARDAVIIDEAEVLTGHTTEVRTASYSPEGTSLVSVSFDGSVKIWDPASAELRTTLTTASEGGSPEELDAMAFSPDGSQLAVASLSGRLRVWDPDSGAVIHELDAHPKAIFAVRFAPDGSQLATASYDRTIKLWDSSSGALVDTLEGHDDGVRALAYSPDGTRLASGSFDASARLWDVASGQAVARLAGHTSYIVGLAFAPDGASLATASLDGTARLWSATTGERLATLHGHGDDVTAVAYSPEGSRLVTTSRDSSARVWDPERAELLTTLAGHEDDLTDLAFAPDGARLLSASKDGSARLWDLERGAMLASFVGHQGAVNDLGFAPDGEGFVSAGEDGTLRLWALPGPRRVTVDEGHRKKIRALAFAPDGAAIASAAADHSARIWDSSTGRQRLRLAHEDEVTAVAFSPDGTRLATASFDGRARIWDPGTGELLRSFDDHEAGLWTLRWSPDGTQVATGGKDTSARIWNAATGEQVHLLEGHGYAVYDLAWSPEGQRLATSGFDYSARIWDRETGELLARLDGHEMSLWTLAWSPDGRRLATVSFDKTARVFDTRTGESLHVLDHEGVVTRAGFSPRGKLLATVSSDERGRIWDAETGALLQTLSGHEEGLWNLAWSPDGQLLATAGFDDSARLWDPRTGEQLAIFDVHGGDIHALVFSPDGTRLATGSDDHRAFVWDPADPSVRVELGDRIGLRQADGTITWPIPYATLTRVGCEQLRDFEDAYATATEICGPLLSPP